MNNEILIKIQTVNLCDALHRNINDNFKSVSFEIIDNCDIQVKIILYNKTEDDDDLIEDISVEFSSLQTEDIVRRFEVVTDINSNPYRNIVYSLGE